MNQKPQPRQQQSQNPQSPRRKWPKWCSVCKNDKHNTTVCKNATTAQRQEGVNEQVHRRTTLAKRKDEMAAWTMMMMQAETEEQKAEYLAMVEWKELYNKIEAGDYKIT